MLRPLVVLAIAAATAIAEPRIVIVQTPAVGLPALRAHIQLHGGRPVTIIQLPDGSEPVGPRARALLAQHTASIVAWIEPAREDPQVLVVHVVTGDRQLELVRIDARTPVAEIERVVALKLVALLDPQQVADPRPVQPPVAKRWRFAIGVGMVVGDDRGVAAGPVIGFGRRGAVGSWIASFDLRGRWLRSGAIEQIESSVSVDETSLALQLEIARPLRRVELFAGAGVAGSLYRANGQAMDGRSGSAIVGVPAFHAHVGLRYVMTGAVVAVETGIEHAAIRQRFLVNGAVAADLQRSRGVGSVWLAIPFR